MDEQDQKILDLIMAGWKPSVVEERLNLQPGVVVERLKGIAEDQGLSRNTSFHPYMRLIYLEAKRRGLLKKWP